VTWHAADFFDSIGLGKARKRANVPGFSPKADLRALMSTRTGLRYYFFRCGREPSLLSIHSICSASTSQPAATSSNALFTDRSFACAAPGKKTWKLYPTSAGLWPLYSLRPMQTAVPVPAQRASAHARFFDHAGPSGRSRCRARTCCLPPSQRRQRPGYESLRGSMAGLCTPLPTLRRRPCGLRRTARGRYGSLLLHRIGLAPTARCRSPSALRKILETTEGNVRAN
jgi:hypothetical protein